MTQDRKSFRVRVTQYPRWLRIIVGVLLIFGGILGALPILGFWMLPLGILILSYDIAPVRRFRRKFDVKVRRLFRAWKNRKGRSL